MPENRKQNRIIIVNVAVISILVLFAILSLVSKKFIFEVILHVFIRILFVPIFVKAIQKCLKDQLTISMKKTLVLCGCTMAIDLVVVDAVRYILSDGISSILFLPVCLPICLMIILYYSIKDSEKDKKSGQRLIFILGIPLLLLSVYFEILSFIELN